MAPGDSPTPPKEFGRLLCHDDGGGEWVGVLLVGGVSVGLMVGGVFAIFSARMILGGLLLVLGLVLLALAVAGIARGVTRTWFYEDGVVQEESKKVRRMAYQDVAQVAYGAWFQANSDMTFLSIEFQPCNGEPNLKFSVSKTSKDKATPTRMSENQVHEIGAMLVLMVAERIEADLDGGRAAAWTADIELRPDGLWLAKEGRFVAWEQIESAEINQSNGYVEVCTHGASKAIIKLPNSDMNARVGMAVTQARCGFAQEV